MKKKLSGDNEVNEPRGQGADGAASREIKSLKMMAELGVEGKTISLEPKSPIKEEFLVSLLFFLQITLSL